MIRVLPAVEVVRRYSDDSFGDPLPVLCLRWQAGPGEHLWELPEGLSLVGPPPQRFGFSARRVGDDVYAARLLWERTFLSWPSLTRAGLLTSSLSPLLSALGTDLWCLLDQPRASSARPRPRAA